MVEINARKLTPWLTNSLFVLLPLFPQGFIILISIVALVYIKNIHKDIRFMFSWLRWFAIYIALGAVGQTFVPESFLPPLPWYRQVEQQPNLLSVESLNSLQGWNKGAVSGVSATYAGKGFWRISRYNPRNGEEYAEIATFEVVKVEPQTQYTLSFYFRSDGSEDGFLINFITRNQYNFVKPHVEDVGNGLKRAFASYTTQSNELELRGLNLAGFSGQWRYIELGYPKLERGSYPSAYTLRDDAGSTTTSRIVWWIGNAAVGLLVLFGCRQVIAYNPKLISTAILLGMFIHGLYGLYQFVSSPDSSGQRVTGFTPQANFFGHFNVVDAGLLWLVGTNLSSLLAIILAFGLIQLSESRAAMLGLWVLVVAWWYEQKKRIKMVAALLMALVVLAVLSLGWNGTNRLSTLIDLQYFSNQSRLQIWQTAQRAFWEYPITGVGVNQFGLYNYISSPANVLEPSVHAHNLFLSLAAETGCLGILAFLLLWGWILWQLYVWRAWKAIVLYILVFLINIPDNTFFSAGVYAPLWVAIAWASLQRTKS